jgi:hypothetical protein
MQAAPHISPASVVVDFRYEWLASQHNYFSGASMTDLYLEHNDEETRKELAPIT